MTRLRALPAIALAPIVPPVWTTPGSMRRLTLENASEILNNL
jgi:hypothetical protein